MSHSNILLPLAQALPAIGRDRSPLLVDYERRWPSAPEASPDAQILAATLGDRVALQAVAVF